MPPATIRKIALVAAVALAAAICWQDARAASYSTGKSGGKLKWLPQQSESAPAEDCATAAQYVPQEKQTPSSAEKSSDNLSPQMPAEPEKPYVPPSGLAAPKQTKPGKGGLNQQELERTFGSQKHELSDECPSPKDLKRIADLSTNITPSEGDLPHDCPLGNATFQRRSFAPMTYTWTASGLCHKPLYFEDEQLERYGHMAGPWVQPFASCAHFFLTIPILPYKMGLELPNECVYSLGYYRPGDCAPYLFDPLPLSVRGALFEAGAWVGGVAIFP